MSLLRMTDDAALQLHKMLRGHLTTQLVYVAARLGIARALAEGAKTAAELAQVISAEPVTLRRILRGLVSLDIVLEDETNRFALAPLGEALCEPALHDWALVTGELLYPAGGGLAAFARSGGRAFDSQLKTDFFSFLTGQDELSNCFYRGLARETQKAIPALCRSFDFSNARLVVDVGGGHGAMAAALLAAHPALRAIVFDRPQARKGAREALARAGDGIYKRARVMSGDFFTKVPRGGDVYLLSWVLHDWDDTDALRILTACRVAFGSGPRQKSRRLLIVEALLPEPTPKASVAIELDLSMMLLTGGRERTKREYRTLLAEAGFELLETRRLAAGRSVLVAGAAR